MKTTFLNPNRRQGMTYMTVVVTMIVVGMTLAAYLCLVGAQNNLAKRSQNWNRGVAVSEAGVEEAMAHLNRIGIPNAAGVVDVTTLVSPTDGWYLWPGSPVNGPWYKVGYMEQEGSWDFYYAFIDTWNGTTNSFPDVMAFSYVRMNDALTPHQGTNVAANFYNDSSIAFLAAINPNMFGQANGYTRRLVSCGLTNRPIFTKALVAKHGIDLMGNNIVTDSYDSSNPLYSTGGQWDINKRRANGDIASNDTVTNTLSVGNADIFGRVATGPMGTVDVGPQGSVGDLAWHAANTRGIKPGYSTDDMNVEFPDVVMPTNITWSALPSGGTNGGVTYDYIFNSSGYFIRPVGSGDIQGKILVTAPNVNIRVDTGWSFGPSDVMVISTNANVQVFLNCASATLAGQGIVNTAGTPNQCYLAGTEKLPSVKLGGNAEASYVLYAPYADVVLNGGGHSAVDLSGALMAKSFKFNGHFNIHYDEALGRSGRWRGFNIISWNEK